MSKKQLQSLLGKLLYIFCVHAARFFVNRLLNNLRKTSLKQMERFDDARNKLDVFVDASLSGMGLYWANNANICCVQTCPGHSESQHNPVGMSERFNSHQNFCKKLDRPVGQVSH